MANPGFVQNAIQVRLLWKDPSRTFMNVLHGQYTSAGPLNPNIADSFMASLASSSSWAGWLNFVPTSTVFTGVDVRDLRSPNLPLISSTGAAEPGTAVELPLPPQVAMVLTMRTAFAGRAFRGRIYFGGLSSKCDDGTGKIADPANTAMQGGFGAIFTAFTTVGATQAILQRWLPARTDHKGNPLPERQPAVVPVTSGIPRDNIFDTQRRRTGARIGSR